MPSRRTRSAHRVSSCGSEPSDIVDLGNHEVQVMNDPLRALAYSDAVMERTGERPHEGHYLSNAVGFPEVQYVTEEASIRLLRHGPRHGRDAGSWWGRREQLADGPSAVKNSRAARECGSMVRVTVSPGGDRTARAKHPYGTPVREAGDEATASRLLTSNQRS